MKKKGRILGTIGWILSFAMVGGVLVYGAMFDKHTVGKANKLIGESTGNVVAAFTKGEGHDETKTLLSDTAESLYAAPATDATYTSFTMKVTYKKEIGSAYSDLESMIYADANYTYVKVSTVSYADRTTEQYAEEYVFVKASGEYWVRQNNGTGGAIASGDSAYLANAKWTKNGTLTIAPGFKETVKYFSDSFAKIDKVTFSVTRGMFTFDDPVYTAAEEGDSAKFAFTLGLNPVINYSTTAKDGGAHYSLAYSNLNNTKVDLPESLKTEMGKGA